MPEETQNPIDQLTKTLTQLQISKGELKKVMIYLENTKHTLKQKEKKLEATKGNVEQISSNLKRENEEITMLKEKLKGNMFLVHVRHLIWDEIISELKNIWEHLTLFSEQKIVVKDIECFIISAKEEDGKNIETTKSIISYLNEKPYGEMRTMDIFDSIGEIMEISKMIKKEAADAKAKECLSGMLKFVATFGSNFDKSTRARYPNYWDSRGNLLPWQQYRQRLVEEKSNADSSHEENSTLGGTSLVSA